MAEKEKTGWAFRYNTNRARQYLKEHGLDKFNLKDVRGQYPWSREDLDYFIQIQKKLINSREDALREATEAIIKTLRDEANGYGNVMTVRQGSFWTGRPESSLRRLIGKGKLRVFISSYDKHQYLSKNDLRPLQRSGFPKKPCPFPKGKEKEIRFVM